MQTRTSSYAATFKIQRSSNNERTRFVAERTRTHIRHSRPTNKFDQQFDQHDKFDQFGQHDQLEFKPNGRIWTRNGFVAIRTWAFHMLRGHGFD